MSICWKMEIDAQIKITATRTCCSLTLIMPARSRDWLNFTASSLMRLRSGLQLVSGFSFSSISFTSCAMNRKDLDIVFELAALRLDC